MRKVVAAKGVMAVDMSGCKLFTKDEDREGS